MLLAGTSSLAWRGGFYPAWSWLLPFASVAFLVFSNLNYNIWLNFQNLLCLGLTLPHYFLGEFVVASVLLVAATIYWRFLPSASLAWLDGINLLLITLALVDLRLTQIMGVRLDWQVIKFGADFTMVWRQARPYLPEPDLHSSSDYWRLFRFVGLVAAGGRAKKIIARWPRRAIFAHCLLIVGTGGKLVG